MVLVPHKVEKEENDLFLVSHKEEKEEKEEKDLFSVTLTSKRGGFRDVWFNGEYKAGDNSGGTIINRPEEDEDDEEEYCYKDLKKIKIYFYGYRKVYLKRVLRAILDNLYRF